MGDVRLSLSSRNDFARGHGLRAYVSVGIATVALITAGALAVSLLGGYVAFDEHSADDGGRAPGAQTVVVNVAEPSVVARSEADVGRRRGGSAVDATRGSEERSGAPGPSETAPGGAGVSNPEQGATGGEGGQTDPGATEPPTDAGDPPVAVPPQQGPPTDDAPVIPPTAGPAPGVSPPVVAAAQAPGPVTALTSGVDQTLATAGLDLPVTELTQPVTEPVDQLLGALTGHH
jgi:hypothetical protein